jgi:hypothetical protein
MIIEQQDSTCSINGRENYLIRMDAGGVCGSGKGVFCGSGHKSGIGSGMGDGFVHQYANGYGSKDGTGNGCGGRYGQAIKDANSTD